MKKSIIYRKTIKQGFLNFFDRLCNKRMHTLAQKYKRERAHKMAIFASESVGIMVNQYGWAERIELETIFDFLSPCRQEFAKGIALDIGANIGNHSLYFSQFFDQVLSFEPHPDNYKLLAINASFRDNIIPHSVGVGDEQGAFTLYENPTSMEGSSFNMRAQNNQGKTHEIPVQKLDDIAKDLKNIHLIKMDVEGFEAQVIRSGEKTIKKHQPIILLEQFRRDFANGTTQAIELLKGHGYTFCWIFDAQMYFAGSSDSKTYFVGTHMRSYAVRTMIIFWEAFFGRRIKISQGPDIPVLDHSMLIAVPDRFARALW